MPRVNFGRVNEVHAAGTLEGSIRAQDEYLKNEEPQAQKAIPPCPLLP